MQQSAAQARSPSFGERVTALNWTAIISNLDEFGCATTEPLLTPEECTVLAESYDSDGLFRSRINHGTARFWARRIQIFRISLAADRHRAARFPLPGPGAGWESLEQGVRHRRNISRNACRLFKALPRRRTKQADAAASPLRSR